MSQSMNFFFVEKVTKQDRQAMMTALRDVMQSMYRGFNVKPVLVNASIEHDQIFLEVPDGLLWGRIMFEPFSLTTYKSLCDEWDDWMRITGEKLRLFIFFPSISDGVMDLISISRDEKERLLSREGVRLFEYFFMAPQEREGMALREWALLDLAERIPSIELEKAVDDIDERYHFFRDAKLDRSELDDFIELGVEAKQAFPV
ncbi:MAG: hypothetical protein JW893_01865 [Candidatus Omnitrophica bacterium]|nr:hypothetical protein [Candidatus Omnitrophota bacterium]